MAETVKTSDMERYQLERDVMTPEVDLNPDTGVLSFTGRVMPTNSYEFFDPIKEWVLKYLREPQEKTMIKIYVDAINTSSAKALMMLFKALSSLKDKGKEVVAEWYYDDEEDTEDWRDYLGSFNIEVRYIATY